MFSIAAVSVVLAQNDPQPRVPDDRLGVDVVQCVDGSRLYGFVLDANVGVTFAVERSWLESHLPDTAERLATEEAERTREQLAKRVARIERWLQERPEPGPMERWLKLELAKTRRQAQEGPTADSKPFFYLMKIAEAELRKVTIQPKERRHIAGIAYGHNLPNIVTTPTTQLARQLDELGVKPTEEQVDLVDRLPQSLEQTEQQWAAKRALVEFDMREALEYQGTGTTLIRKGDQADPAALIGQLLGAGGLDPISQLGAELGLPEFARPNESKDWWKSVTSAAERDGFHGVLVTRLQQNLLSPEVVVECSFFAHQSPGKWFEVVTFRGTSNANQQAAERIARIKEDPQIQSVLSTFKALGLSADQRLDQALRQGAATEEAMEGARAQWNKFASRYTQSLGSPIPISEK
ncbi:MAG: hypothetical protein R3C53_14310 [Pirellulaceae bacterium]